jgi:PAS domain S-box-containing protein
MVRSNDRPQWLFSLSGSGWVAAVPWIVLAAFAALAFLSWGGGWKVAALDLGVGVIVALLLYLSHRRLARLEHALDIAFRGFDDVGLLLTDEAGIILAANDAAARLHGRPAREIAGMQAAELLAPSHRGFFDTLRARAIAGERAQMDLLDLCGDGDAVDIEWRGAALRQGGPVRLLLLLTDVSERKRAETRQALLARKVLQAQEDERLRISRELHDELGQLLTALHLEINWVQKQFLATDPGAPARFEGAVKLVEDAAAKLRILCRGLRPPSLDDLGILPSIRLLVEDFDERTGIEVRSDIRFGDEDAKVPNDIALCTYRILQESLTNVSRHSMATRVDLQLERTESHLRLQIGDNGRGFDLVAMADFQGSGLTGMRERARLVDGTLEIGSQPGQGTQIRFRVKLPAADLKEEKR